MVRTPEEIDELKAKLSLARKRPVNFGLCLGRGGDGTVLLLHRRKPPDLLCRRAKKKGETQKTASGHLELKSRTVIMTCLAPPPPMMARQMRLYLRDFDLLFKVDIVESGGDVIDTEGSDDGTDPTPLLETSVSKTDEHREKWQKIEAALDGAVARAVQTGGPKSDTVEAAWAGAKDAALKGNYKAALTVAKKIKPYVIPEDTAKADRAADNADAAKWAKVEKQLKTKLEAAVAVRPAKSEKLKQAFAAAEQKARTGDYKSASLVARKLNRALDKAIAQTQFDRSDFDTAHDALAERLRQVGLAFPTVKLVKQLRAVRLEVERPPQDLHKALTAVSEIDAQLSATAKSWFAGIKDEASKALSTIGKYRGVTDQHAHLNARLAGIDPAFHRTPPDYDEIAATHAAIMADCAALKRISDGCKSDYKEWIAKKKNWCDLPLKKLKDPALESEKLRITNMLTQAQNLLDTNNLPRAKRLITAAYWDIKAAEQMLADKAAFAALLNTATTAVTSLTDLDSDELEPDASALKRDIASAFKRAKAQNYYTARIILDSIPSRVSNLMDDIRRRVDPEYLKTLAIRAEKLRSCNLNNEIQNQLSQVSDTSARTAEVLITAAEIAAGKQPTKEQLRTFENNSRTFDDLLNSLPDAAASDLLAARYGSASDISGSSQAEQDLKNLHNALTGTGRLETARFTPVKRKKDANYTTSPGPMIRERISDNVITSAYNPFAGKIGATYGASQLGKVDPECVAPATNQDAKPDYGRWAAFHQIGQAINARTKFMQTNGSKKTFGCWLDHGSDISVIAQSVARHFGVDRAFVERAVRGKTEIPDPSGDQDPDTWNEAYEAALYWLSEARCTATLWNSDTRSAAHRIGTRVIHEATKDHWVSYDYSARSKGVSGRQFRSPGDWFAELYAAYQTNVMNPAHPARDWLTKL